MDPIGIGLFQVAEQKLAWLDRRQELLAHNIANVDTPNYRPRDLAPFASALASAAGGLLQTDPMHLAPSGAGAGGRAGAFRARAPNGNGVSLEEQLGQVADTSSQQELTLNVMRRYQSMFRTAFGRTG